MPRMAADGRAHRLRRAVHEVRAVAAVHVDVWASALHLTPLAPREWGIVVAASLVPAVAGQLARASRRPHAAGQAAVRA